MILLAGIAINWHSFFFLLFALLTCVFAVSVLFSSNIVHMAFYLVISLGSTAGLFFLAGAHFIGAMQLMIYVGATLVLLIFGVMLTAQEKFISMKTGAGEWVLAAILGGSLLALLLAAAFSVDSWLKPSKALQERIAQAGAGAEATTPLGLGLVGVRVDKLDQQDTSLLDGMSGYLLPFEIVSVHLLVVLIGAAYLARTKRRKGRDGPAAGAEPLTGQGGRP